MDAAGARPRGGVQRRVASWPRLAALFALDAFAGGFIVQSLMAYWLYLRYGADPATLGAIFFGTNLLAALSFLAAAPLARRFGLLNTMVFSHLPSNLLLVLVPFMPTLGAAVALLLARYLLSQLDVPTRQSYTMAIVDPSERAAAAGVLSVARNAGAALGPLVASPALAIPALGLPFIFARRAQDRLRPGDLVRLPPRAPPGGDGPSRRRALARCSAWSGIGYRTCQRRRTLRAAAALSRV